MSLLRAIDWIGVFKVTFTIYCGVVAGCSIESCLRGYISRRWALLLVVLSLSGAAGVWWPR